MSRPSMQSAEPNLEFSAFDPADPEFAVSVVDALLPVAIRRGASDIHLQPREDGWEVWFRVDGVLSPNGFLRGGGSSDPVSRLMVLAGLPTYRSSQPMEGRIQWEETPDAADVSMRLGVYPTVHGARAVIRLLRHHSAHETIETLGLSDAEQKLMQDLCSQTDGAVLLAGPAGSGKTTSMYAMLRDIAGRVPRRSVMTIEDPVETVVESISQSELDPSGGMTLAS
ncbi:MAG: ATPase, T2SS/T4P/T4SS family, partial [Rubripirellula sp.]